MDDEHKSDVEQEIHDLNADVEHIDAEDERLARARARARARASARARARIRLRCRHVISA